VLCEIGGANVTGVASHFAAISSFGDRRT